MGGAEMLALGGLAALFLALSWWTRRSVKRPAKPALAPELRRSLEQQADSTARCLLAGAKRRLANLKRELAEPDTAARLHRDVVRLAAALGELQRAPTDDPTPGHEWDYLAAVGAERWPLIEPSLVALELPSLRRGAEDREVLERDLSAVAVRWEEQLDAAAAALSAEPALLWCLPELLVLTLLVAAADAEGETAAAAQLTVDPRRAEAATALRTGLEIAGRLVGSTPRHERIPHAGLPVPPLSDLSVAAAVVQHRLTLAAAEDELARARALVLGDPSVLWIALAVLERHEYPRAAAVAHARLAELARRAGAEGREFGAADESLAQELLGAEGAVAFLAALRAIAAGRCPEELFGGGTRSLPAPAASPTP